MHKDDNRWRCRRSVIGALCILMLCCGSTRKEHFFFSTTNTPDARDGGTVDSDVMAEKIKIRTITSYSEGAQHLIVKDLTKFYGKYLAVNQICVGVNK